MEEKEFFKDLPRQAFQLLFDVILANGSKYPTIQRAAETIENELHNLSEPEQSIISSLYGLNGFKASCIDEIAKSSGLSITEVVAKQRNAFAHLDSKIKIWFTYFKPKDNQ